MKYVILFAPVAGGQHSNLLQVHEEVTRCAASSWGKSMWQLYR